MKKKKLNKRNILIVKLLLNLSVSDCSLLPYMVDLNESLNISTLQS